MLGARSFSRGTAMAALSASLRGCLCAWHWGQKHPILLSRTEERFFAFGPNEQRCLYRDGVTEQRQWDLETLSILSC